MKSISRYATFLILASVLAPRPALTEEPRLLEKADLIKSADTQLYLELRGRADRSPILLYLHGGPGNPFGVAFRSCVGSALESRFLVCYLHQRGVLNSPAVPDAGLTVAHHVSDVHNVIRYTKIVVSFPA